ncbi:hypothetical protein [Bifidobacterium platyrrhinorum]|uniref:Uncharacterized protein n=1 Tax=Bifidobacterium platyrrhinorum TaxID=2661628 RepID=A0A6L9SU67_9BIFI|nr:hypothetical protein [Bifidobacterium platyrrhinorum]NEG56128.1 hypothetical protein [Bifidobacterium platyrrhinorum]
MADLIVTDADRRDDACLQDFTLDLAWGSGDNGENDFELTAARLIPAGALVYMDGGECGGVVDAMRDQLDASGSTLTYTGRTWHGILAGKVLQPDKGKDYLTVSGAAGTVIASLLSRIGLTPFFQANQPAGVNPTVNAFQFDRYIDAYTGLTAMCKANGLKLRLAYRSGHVDVWAEPAAHYGDTIDSDILDFDATRTWRRVNHLIGMGKGDLAARIITHWYADEKGNVSQTQSMTGIDEITETYDYNNLELAELNEKTRQKLLDEQSQGDVSATVRDGAGILLDVGDTLSARDNITGITVDATVVKKIVKVTGDVTSVDYEAE